MLGFTAIGEAPLGDHQGIGTAEVTANIVLPSLKVTAVGIAGSQIAIPAVTTTTTVKVEVQGSLDAELPALKLTSSVAARYDVLRTEGTLRMPRLRVAATVNSGTPFPDRAILPLVDNSSDLQRSVSRVNERIPLLLDPNEIRRARQPTKADARWLALLAWERSVDEWQPAWTTSIKQGAITGSYDYHAHKGTRYALDLALSHLNMPVQVQEWFEYGGRPYRFSLKVGLDNVTPFNLSDYGAVIRVVLTAKNVRSFLERIRLQRQAVDAKAYLVCYSQSRVVLRTSYDPLTNVKVSASAYIGAGAFIRHRVRVG